jgi:hypothetical protein
MMEDKKTISLKKAIGYMIRNELHVTTHFKGGHGELAHGSSSAQELC